MRKVYGKVKPKNIGRTLRRIFSYMAEDRIQLISVFIFLLFSTLSAIFGTALLKILIDNYITPMIGNPDPLLKERFGKVLSYMAALYLFGAFSTWASNRLMIAVSVNTLYRIRIALFAKMESLPVSYFSSHTHGELMSRYTNDTDALREMFSRSITNFFSSFITVTGVFIMMVIYSWQLTILVLIMLVFIMNAVSFIGKKSSTHFSQQQQKLGIVNGYLEEMFEGLKTVKVFSYEEIAKERFRKINEELRFSADRASTFSNILMPVMGNLSHIHYAATAFVGGIFAIKGILSLGTVVAFLQFTRSFSHPITQASQEFSAVMSALAGAERIFGIMDEPIEKERGTIQIISTNNNSNEKDSQSNGKDKFWVRQHPEKSNAEPTLTPAKGKIVFENVHFSYDKKNLVLNNISFQAKPGETIAFVGSTGAGKTTITNLMNRFYDLSKGAIYYDDINIKEIRKKDLRRSLAMVLQDTHLFTGTVMENIRYGRLSATDEEVMEAARLSNADSFIQHLSHRYHTVLTGAGANLSQGQRQLLAIARAGVANPAIIILDEATSSIDTRTEKLVEEGLQRLMRGRTVLIIAHRLSTVRNANRILVIEDGEIVEQGDHSSLIAQQGRYYRLYTGAVELV